MRPSIKNRLCALAFLLAGTSSPAQPQDAAANAAGKPAEFALADPYFVQIGDNDSIPFGVITAQVQDARGLLWFGTQNGLVRYDGYRYRKFTHVHDDPRSLSGDFVNCLAADADGRIWVGTSGTGLSVFDPATEQFDNYHHSDTDAASLSAEEVTAVVADAKGGHWIGTAGGLNYVAPGVKGFTRYMHQTGDPASLTNDSVRSLLIDHAGRLWIGENDGLQRLARNASRFERIASERDSEHSFSGKKIRSIMEAADGKIWIGTGSNGIAWLDSDGTTPHWPDPTSTTAGHAAIKAIAQPRPDQLWVATFGDGIDIISAADGHVIKSLHHDSSLDNSLGSNTIGSLNLDRNGELWVGTWGGGLQLFSAANRAFHMLRHSPTQTSGLSHADIHSVLQLQDGRIAVGTGGNGIDVMDREHGVLYSYRPTSDKHNAPSDLPDGSILALAQAPDGTLWAGTQRMGIVRLAPGATKWEIFSFGPKLRDNAVNGMLVSKRGDVYAATDNGIWRMKSGQAQFLDLKTADGTAMHAPAYPLAEDSHGRIWAGSLHGLWVIEPDADSMQGLHPDLKQPGGITTDIIGGLLIDHQDRLWVATAEGLDRLLAWDGKHAEFAHESVLAGRAGQTFGSNLLEDKTGRIWSEDHVYDPQRKKIDQLTKADGLDFGVSWVGAHAHTSDGLLLQGGTQGLAIIDPEQYHPPAGTPPLVASELKINGIVQPFSLAQQTLELQPIQRNFSVEFSALDYSAPQKNRYRYRLTGYDDNWIDTDAGHRIASYGNLWPGDYTLEVRGTNRAGDWSPQSLSIPIRVLPAFWQTTWFLLLLIVAAGAVVATGYRWRLALLNAKAAGLQKLVDARTHELMEKNRELEHLAVTDRLTGLYNRLRLDQILEAEIARSERYDGKLALVMIDLDKFKSVNDEHGHQVGDKVLSTLADILATNTRDVDAVGRWGGEEFLIIASNTDLAGATEVAEKLRQKIAEHAFPVVGGKTASFGVTAFRKGDNATDMLARADAALYRAKESGRDRVECIA